MKIKQRDVSFGVSSGIKIGNEFWCISSYFNGLWKFDLDTLIGEKIIDLKMKNALNQEAYVEVVNYGDWICVIPARDNDIVMVNATTNSVRIISLPIKENEIFNKQLPWFTGAVVFDKWMFIFPGGTKNLIRVDLGTNEVAKEIIINEEAEGYAVHPSSSYISDGKIYFSSGCKDILYCVDCINFSTQEHKFNSKGIGISNIVVSSNNNVYLLPENKGAVIKMNLESGEIKEISDYPENYLREDYRSIIGAICYNNTIYIFPCYGNMVLKIEDDHILECKWLTCFLQNQIAENDRKRRINDLLISKVYCFFDEIFIVSPLANAVFSLDLNKENFKKIELKISDKECEKLFEEYEEKSLVENYYFSLERYIDIIIKK